MDAFEAISSPDSASLRLRRFFTITEANRSLVLVRRIVEDIVREYTRLRELHATCGQLDNLQEPQRAEDLRQQYAAAADDLAALREELDEIGCELKDFNIGLIDFPAMRDGREVLLCWKLGEEKVAYWHEVNTGFTGRQPIHDEHWPNEQP